MAYADVNQKHCHIIRQIYVDNEGKALIVLRDGGGMKVDSPEEADKELTNYERMKKDHEPKPKRKQSR